jgi:hypothetical protein
MKKLETAGTMCIFGGGVLGALATALHYSTRAQDLTLQLGLASAGAIALVVGGFFVHHDIVRRPPDYHYFAPKHTRPRK